MDNDEAEGNEVAPDGQVFVCSACGKRSRDRFGFQRIDRGFDESCMLNAVRCFDDPEEERNARQVAGKPMWLAVPEKEKANE